MKDGLTPGLRDADNGIASLAKKAKAATAGLKAGIKEQADRVKQATQRVKELERAYSKLSPGAGMTKAKAELEAAKKLLEDEQEDLEELKGRLDAVVQATAQFGGSMRTRMRELTEEIAALTIEYGRMSDEEKNTAAGQQLKQHIDDLTEQAGELREAMGDATVAINNAASDTRTFDQVTGGLQVGVDGFGLATGAAELFGASEEDLVAAQTKLQSVLVISNALTSIQNQLQAQSAVMQGVHIIQTKAAATAEAIKTAAQGKGVVVTKLATVAQAAFNAVAKANPYVLLAGALVTVVGALFAFSKGSAAAKKAEEERQAAEAEGRAEMVRARFEIDQTVESLKNFNGTKDEEKKKVNELNRKYGEAFGYYDTVAQWYDILYEKAEAYVQILFLQAKAQALVNKAVEADKEVAKAEAMPDDEAEGAHGGVYRFFARFGAQESGGQISVKDVDKSIDEHNKQAKQRAVETAKRNRDAILEEAKGLYSEIAELKKKNGIGGHDVPDSTKTPKNTPSKDPLEEERRIAEELMSLRRKNQQDDIDLLEEGKEKRLRQIEQEYDERRAELTEQEAKWKEAQGGTLTKEQTDELDTAKTLAEEKRDKSVADVEREELEVQAASMREYLKEYGTFQQQKLAIAEEYAVKISKATTAGEKKQLEAEKNAALQKVDIAAIKQSVDWGGLFGEFGTMFKEQLQPTVDKLTAISKSEEFKSSPIEEQRAVYELISKLREASSAWDGDIFKRVSDDMTAYQTALQGLTDAQERERKVQEETAVKLSEARSRLHAAVKTGDTAGMRAATQEINALQQGLEQASDETRKFSSQVEETTENLKASSAAALNMFQGLEQGLRSLTSGSLQGIGSGLMQLDKLFGDGQLTKAAGNALAKGVQKLFGEDSKAAKTLTAALGNSGMAGQIISAVLGILDVLKDGVSGLVVNLQDTVFGAVEGILDDVFSGDIVVEPLKNAVQHVGGILDTVTFGGFSSWVGNGESDPHLREDLERLALSNEVLKNAIDNLAEKMEDGAVADATAVYEQQKAYLNESMRNTQESMRRSGGAYSNGFLGIGGSHSSDYKINKGMSGADWDRVSKVVGVTVRDAGAFWNLTSKQMAQLATEAPDLYAKIKDLADDGHENAAQYMDSYIEYYRQLEELEDAWREKLTGASFDSIRDEFKNTLMDMGADSETFSKNFSELMRNAMVESMLSGEYDKRLKEWYAAFADDMKDGNLDNAEGLREWWNSIVGDARKEMEGINEATGYDEISGASQSGKAGGISTMTQDQGTKLDGMFTSGLQHWSSMDNRMEDVSAKMDMAESHLARIAENTGTSAGHLGEIKEDIKRIIRDGLNVR